jgi:periplasmic divalent cation tolerance protein
MSLAAPGQQQELSTGVVVVYVTVPNKDVARQIAFALVDERLAACTNIIPGLESVYEWDGKIQSDNELLLMIKTSASLIPSLTNKVKELHPYDECEVIAVPVIGGSSTYLQWVMNSATADGSQE